MSNLKLAAGRTNEKTVQLNQSNLEELDCLVHCDIQGRSFLYPEKSHTKRRQTLKGTQVEQTHQVPRAIPNRYSMHVCTHTPHCTLGI